MKGLLKYERKTKQKVKEKVAELGEKLIKLYAEREASKGFACEPDTEEQIEFEFLKPNF